MFRPDQKDIGEPFTVNVTFLVNLPLLVALRFSALELLNLSEDRFHDFEVYWKIRGPELDG